MDGDGGPLTRLTKAPGKHTTAFSPDEHWIADVYSYTNKPPDLFVQENHAEGRCQAASPLRPRRVLDSSPGWMCRSSMFTARDGVKVPARLFKPANFKKGGPGVVFVHGAGYLQNVDH